VKYTSANAAATTASVITGFHRNCPGDDFEVWVRSAVI